MSPFDSLAGQRHILLTTQKRDGTTVGTPTYFAVDGDRVFVRTYGKAFKWRRVRNFPDKVEIAPSTFRGKPTGGPIPVHGRILEGEDYDRAGRALRAKHRFLHGFAFPNLHRLMRTPTIHMEFTPR